MKDNDQQQLWEAYNSDNKVVTENVGAIAKFLPKIIQFIKSNPEVLKQLLQVIPELASMLKPAAPAAPVPATPMTAQAVPTGPPPGSTPATGLGQ